MFERNDYAESICFPCVRELKNDYAESITRFEMFPVCAGIETRSSSTASSRMMFPVCAGIETSTTSTTSANRNVSRVCGN